jgi:hypothetical protein
MSSFNGLGLHMGNLSLLSKAKTRSLSPENPNGAVAGGGRAVPELDEHGKPVGPARYLGKGWKVRPYIEIQPGETAEVANIDGPGAIQQIWMTPTGVNRTSIIRFYWDDQELPSVECPVGDFFASPYTNFNVFAQVTSLPVCVNPGNAFNCYWEMPFRKRSRITIENRDVNTPIKVYYQINYTLTEVPENAAYFHAQFRRSRPVMEGKVHTILDNISGEGHYVGTVMAWQVNHNGWWGEGEIKFYLDGDADPEISNGEAVGGSTGYPTICGTGAEDYFCGSYNFENKETKQYQEFTTPYAGMPHVVRPDGVYNANTRFALYRWHVMDPIRFEQDIKVTIQSLGWTRRGDFLQRLDDIASVAFWYQTLPTPATFPDLPKGIAIDNI